MPDDDESFSLTRLKTTGLAATMRQAHTGDLNAWNPPFCGEIDMRIAADGQWFYQQSPIARPALVKLFAQVLRREADGRYYLVTPVEKCAITVEDAPFLAVALQVKGQGDTQELCFETNLGEQVMVGAEHPLRFAVQANNGGLKPYVRIRGGLEALLTRSLSYDVMALATVRDGWIGVWSGGQFFAMQRADEIEF